MILRKLSPLLFGAFVAAMWVCVAAQYSHADREVETYSSSSSSSDTDVAPPVESERHYEYKSERREIARARPSSGPRL
jgi:hypothetical protein